MGSSKQATASTRERQVSLLARVAKVEQQLDNRRIAAGYAGNGDDARAFHVLRDELRRVVAEWNTVFSDEDNDREFDDFNAKKTKSTDKVKKHASQNRF